ncbi:hypothetical protein os4_38730 (plasmid) [Comamonadaceae bacterium OS-4]|nr:hypothetical protein os4_38730 [Comamonadaceae bacterium OS-4]
MYLVISRKVDSALDYRIVAALKVLRNSGASPAIFNGYGMTPDR